MGFRVWGLRRGSGFGFWGGFGGGGESRVWGLGFRVWEGYIGLAKLCKGDLIGTLLGLCRGWWGSIVIIYIYM